MFIRLRASGLKATSAEAYGKTTKTATTQNKQSEKVILQQDLNLQRLNR